jgi:hypothetical protein
MPRTKERFDRYLFMLQGVDKNDIILPIALFNPMGKELAKEKLDKLIALNAEDILEDVISQFNKDDKLTENENSVIKVAINLIDDVEGSWSDYYTTDYKNKFEIESLLKRNFCTPAFWTSESVTEKSITRRIEECIFRTKFWIAHGKPEKLTAMLEQEIAVQMNFDNIDSNLNEAEVENIEKFIAVHKDSEAYSINLNFFYGDEGSSTLNYPTFGLIKNGGFEYAKYIANQRRKAYHTQTG